jgi:hypothetical protein
MTAVQHLVRLIDCRKAEDNISAFGQISNLHHVLRQGK